MLGLAHQAWYKAFKLKRISLRRLAGQGIRLEALS
jgi:ribosomal protein S14